ncbi:phosphatase PAP2 family protein [Glacieibacterium sp.]|uniref:phosphatase PAP2 family protein n=1 Tax=Glacieibacterium sp. TaxID=2860237 RepID=UPI003AFF838F
MQQSLIKAVAAVEAADITVAHVLAPVDENPLVHALGRLGDLGDQPPMIAAGLAVVTLGILRWDRKHCLAGTRMLAALGLATALKTVVKKQVNRSRPALMFEEGRYISEVGDTQDKRLKSFPSGHTAGVVAIAATAARAFPHHAVPVWSTAASVALVQISRRSHFVSDVVAGAAVGLVAAEIIDRLFHRSTGTKRVHRPY